MTFVLTCDRLITDINQNTMREITQILKAMQKYRLDVGDFAILEANGYDPYSMQAEEMVNKLVDLGVYEDTSMQAFNTHQDIISQSF